MMLGGVIWEGLLRFTVPRGTDPENYAGWEWPDDPEDETEEEGED